MTPEYLKKQIAKLPSAPGVYLFKNAAGTPLYIGKASSLKSRVLAYAKTTDIRLRKMVATAKYLEARSTGSDIEALILESQLIKKHQPQFNIMLRDDKQYFFVAFTDEQFPHVFLTHQSNNKKIKAPIGDLIGPFTDGSALKFTLKQLRRIFPYCTCKQKHHVRCLNAHIGKCPGVCCLKEKASLESVKQYLENIKAIKDILSGKRARVIRSMMLDKPEEAFKLERVFQNARIIRTAASNNRALVTLQKDLHLAELPVRIEGYDISNIQGIHATGSMVTFVNGQPDKNFYRKFKIKTVSGADDTAMLKEIMIRRFNHPEWEFPQLIVLDGGKGQLNAARTALSTLSLKIPILALTKNDRHQGDHIFVNSVKNITPLALLSPASRHLIIYIDEEAHRFAISYYRHLHRKNI